VTPPFDVPEECQHFFRCYQFSQGIVYAEKNEKGVPGGDLPASLSQISLVIHNHAANEYDFHITQARIDKALGNPLDPVRKRFAGFPSTARFSPAPYLPAAVALWAGRRASLTALEELYIGRVGTLAGYLLAVVAAVWLTPVHKWLMALIALMPMSIFLAASLSADALTIAYSLLAIAMVLRLALQPDSLGRRDVWWLGGILLLVALAKPAYVFISLLFLIVPKDKFADRGQCWRARAWMIGLPIAVSIAWTLSSRELCVPYRDCVDVHGQMLWILANPWQFTQMVFLRLTDGYTYSGIIATLGWGTVWMDSNIYTIYWTALLVAAVLDGGQDEVRVPMRARAVSFGVYVVVLTVIATLTYLFWHGVGEDEIHGVQSRYFVPLLPLLLLPLRTTAGICSSRFSRWLVPALAMVAILTGVGGTWQAVIARFYWE
jgi:uncharacterized membrane protein